MRRFSMIGTGNLGCHMVDALTGKGYILKYIYKKTRFPGFFSALTGDMELLVREAGFVIIATQESKIREAAETIAATAQPKGKIFFHTSNALHSGELQCLKDKGAYIASFSPLQTFPEYLGSAGNFQGITFLAEGDPEAVDMAREIATDLGAQLLVVDKEKKIHFHIAAVSACNFLIAILQLAEKQLHVAGPVEPGVTPGLDILMPLIKQTLENVGTRGTAASLTGPVSRKETAIIAKHLAVLTGDDAVLYRTLSDYLLHNS